MIDSTPKGYHEPEITVYPNSTGFTVTVGYHIDKYWYPCRREYAGSERTARRKAKWLVKWYRDYVERTDKAERIEIAFASDDTEGE